MDDHAPGSVPTVVGCLGRQASRRAGTVGTVGLLPGPFCTVWTLMGTTHTAVGPALATKYCAIGASHLTWNGRFIVRRPLWGRGGEMHVQCWAQPLTEGRVPWLLTREPRSAASQLLHRLAPRQKLKRTGATAGVPSSPEVKFLGTVKLISKCGV